MLGEKGPWDECRWEIGAGEESGRGREISGRVRGFIIIANQCDKGGGALDDARM